MKALMIFCMVWVVIGVVLCGVIDRKTDFFENAPDGVRGVCAVFWPLVFIYTVFVLIERMVWFISKKDGK